MALKSSQKTVPPAVGSPEWLAPVNVAKRRRKFTRQLFRAREKQYRWTKNAVFAWEAIDAAFTRDAALPAWVRSYLRRVATQIAALSRTPHTTTPSRAVYQALEFDARRGAPNPFAELHDQWHEVNVALEVWRYLNEGHQVTYAKGLVAKEHPRRCTLTPKCASMSAATVVSYWQKHEAHIRRGR